MRAKSQIHLIEPEHLVWGLSRAALLVALVFLPILIFSPGLIFWVDLLKVIPIMLMGGMCSPDMMVRILTTIANFAILVSAAVAAKALMVKLRFAFDQSKDGGRAALWRLPGPTVWQARLYDVRLRSKARRGDAARLFRPLQPHPA